MNFHIFCSGYEEPIKVPLSDMTDDTEEMGFLLDGSHQAG
jgi:hypothetical protein